MPARADACTSCGAGTEVNGAGSACVACAAGKVPAAADPAGCVDCPIGRSQASGDDPSTPEVEPTPCAAWEPTMADPLCVVGHTYCRDCRDGTVAPDPGAADSGQTDAFLEYFLRTTEISCNSVLS